MSMESELTPAPGEERERNQDRTASSVARQLWGMGCTQFDVGVKEAAGRLINLVDTRETILPRLSFLKYQNANGSDIYIRPVGSVGIVLVDDLTIEAIQRMKAQGHQPAVVTQTSPENYQAWVRVSKEPILPAIATAVARALANEYQADQNSADWHHYSRLAGFTNRKPAYQRSDGTYPFVLLIHASGGIARNAQELLSLAASITTKAEPKLADPFYPVGGSVSNTLAEAFRREVEIRAKFYPRERDYSRMDYAILKSLAIANPSVTAQELMLVLLSASPDLERRKQGHVEDYIARTVQKVLSDPQVRASRQ